jgi:membrane fusion protein, heavy metal efflux system
MNPRVWLRTLVFLALLVGCDSTRTGSHFRQDAKKDQPAPTHHGPLQAPGRTEAVPSRKAIISAVPAEPVVEVAVAPGDRVKKGQTLVRLDDDEAKADVRAKEAALERARIELQESRRYLESAEALHKKGALSDHHIHETRVAALKAEADERQAQALLEGAKGELEHYTLQAPIDGVITRLDVSVGQTLRPTTKTWGEILDLSEIDVRCELTPEQADQIAVGHTAEVEAKGKGDARALGKVVYVGIAADQTSGLVPVVVRLANDKLGLGCAVQVTVRFGPTLPEKSSR